MTVKSLAEQAAALAAKTYEIKKPLVVDSAEVVGPKSGKPVYRFKVVSAANANGPAYVVMLNENGEALELTPELQQLFDRTVLTTVGGPSVAPITIRPNTNILTISSGQTIDETITVTIPRRAGPAKADVYGLYGDG
jgi:hypothetical protein